LEVAATLPAQSRWTPQRDRAAPSNPFPVAGPDGRLYADGSISTRIGGSVGGARPIRDQPVASVAKAGEMKDDRARRIVATLVIAHIALHASALSMIRDGKRKEKERRRKGDGEEKGRRKGRKGDSHQIWDDWEK
jgi:hypothetical protein